MVLFLKTVAIIFALSLIVPLSVWAGSNRANAWFAFKQYMLCLGLLMGVPFLLVLLINLIRSL